MSRNDTHTRRSQGPLSGAEVAQRPLLSLLARAAKPSELLSALHQCALDAAGGDCALLFRHNPRNGALQATSGFGLEFLPTGPWRPEAGEASLVSLAFERGRPTLVPDADRRMPDLAARLGAAAVLL